jgi:hypothetical protein
MSGQGVAYPAPTELLPIFNSTVYTSGTNTYLNFPVAQGAETITTLSTTNFTLNNSQFALGTGSSATLASQIAIGASTNKVYIPTPLRSINEIDTGTTNLNYLSRRDVGVYLMSSNVSFELPYSITDLRNQTNQAITSNLTALSTPVPSTTGSAGNWASHPLDKINELFIVYPNYGIRGFTGYSYTSGENINFQNNTNNPVFVQASANNSISSVRIYYKGVEMLQQ